MDLKLKRGIDLQNRVLESELGKRFKKASKLWDGGPIDRFTFLGLFIVFILNAFLVSSLFGKTVSDAFSSSTFLLIVAHLFNFIGMPINIFFSIVAFASLLFAPISMYLFVRRIVHRHELTAFIATLLFVIPNPISPQGIPVLFALFRGDGSHAVVFCFMPLFLLYFRAFVQKGLFAWGFLSAFGTALIAIVSPFSMFHLFIFFMVITIAEGFVGEFRMKFLRFLAVLLFAFGLSYFWYHPGALTKIVVLDGVSFAISYFWKMFPLLIPIIPTVGAISFLIFDRREKLQPIFIALALFVVYTFLMSVSASYSITGIFMSERYAIELSFARSFLVSLLLGFALEVGYHKLKEYIIKQKLATVSLLKIGTLVFSVLLFVFSTYQIFDVRSNLSDLSIVKASSSGAGSIRRTEEFFYPITIVSDIVSVGTFLFLLYLLKEYPPTVVKREA